MEYVIDASVAVKWFLPELHSEKADALLNDFLHQGLNLLAPDLIVPEVTNTFWKRCTLTKEISLSEATESCTDFLRLPLTVERSAIIAERALNFAVQEHHRVYDALYVMLALHRGCGLNTADEALVNKLSDKFPMIRWLGSLTIP